MHNAAVSAIGLVWVILLSFPAAQVWAGQKSPEPDPARVKKELLLAQKTLTLQYADFEQSVGRHSGVLKLSDVDLWYIACLDCAEDREAALDKLGSILGFVAAYILGREPEQRGVPPELAPAVRELRATYATRRHEMDAALVKRLGLFDYLRRRLAIAGTPDDCIEQVRAAEKAGATRLMFTVSLAADPVRTIELFGRHVMPAVAT